MDQNIQPKPSSRRLRIGLILFVISFLPFPLVLLAIIHTNGSLESPKDSSTFLLVTWGLQYVIGFIGLFFAGKESINMIKAAGYKKLPGSLWKVVRYGNDHIEM